jgi:rhamnosyl/mannosyltransferase
METFLAALMRAEQNRGHDSRAVCHAWPGQAGTMGSGAFACVARQERRVSWPRATGPDGAAANAVQYDGVLFAKPLSPSSEFALAPGYPALARSLCRSFEPDAVCLHMPNISGMLTAMTLDRPLVAFWHAPVRSQDIGVTARLFLPAYRQLERAALRRARRIVVTSRAMLEGCPQLERHRHKCRVVPLGIEPPQDASPFMDAAAPPPCAGAAQGGCAPHRHGRPAFYAPATPRQCVTILSLGRFAPYKGFDVLVRALALVPEARLVLAGDGPERANVMALAGRLGLSERAAFPGRIDDATRERLYASCDIFCLPSVSPAEAFGLVLLEAMARGKPVAASRPEWSGVGEVVEHGVTGLLVPPRDPAALARALRTLADDKALARRMGEAGRERARHVYSMDTAARRMERVYAAVAGHGRA